MPLPWFVLACTAPSTSPAPTSPSDTTPPIEDTATSMPNPPPETGDTGTPTTDTAPDVDCAALPAGPVPFTPYDIATQEDFDFDAEGRLVYMDGASMSSNLLGTDAAGVTDVVAVNLADTRGISTLEDGTLAVAMFADGRIVTVDPATGVIRNLLVGLVGPNALEVDDADTLYFTDYGTVNRLELGTGEVTELARGFIFPNGLTLDDDHDTLYVADNTVGIYRMTEGADGAWSAPELVVEAGVYAGSFDALEVDVCGNLYALGFDNGALYRFDPVTFAATLLRDFTQPTGAGYNAIHWGGDAGGWRRDVLYVTNRDDVFGAEVGVPGRAQPVDAVP